MSKAKKLTSILLVLILLIGGSLNVCAAPTHSKVKGTQCNWETKETITFQKEEIKIMRNNLKLNETRTYTRYITLKNLDTVKVTLKFKKCLTKTTVTVHAVRANSATGTHNWKLVVKDKSNSETITNGKTTKTVFNASNGISLNLIFKYAYSL